MPKSIYNQILLKINIFIDNVKKKISNIENNKFVFYIINIIVFTILFIMNNLVGYQGDDFDYMNDWSTGEPLTSFTQIIPSMIVHYKNWGGRIILHGILQFLLISPKYIFDILNTLIFIGIANVLYTYLKKKNIDNFLLLAIYTLLFITFDNGYWYYFTFYTVSVNYIWPTFICIYIALVYYKSLSKQLSSFEKVSISFLSFLAGFSHEGISIILILYIILIFLYKYISKMKIYNFEKLCFTFIVLGYIILFIAPGNFARAHIMIQRGKKDGFVLIKHISTLFYHFFKIHFIVFILNTLMLFELIKQKKIDAIVIILQFCIIGSLLFWTISPSWAINVFCSIYTTFIRIK